jgi:hypothetical protein
LVHQDPSLSNDENILKEFSEEDHLHGPGWNSFAGSIRLILPIPLARKLAYPDAMSSPTENIFPYALYNGGKTQTIEKYIIDCDFRKMNTH